jgi:hypothetical protein
MDGMIVINPPTILKIPAPLYQPRNAAPFQVLRLVDHTHPAAAEPRQNAIMRNGFPDHCRNAREIFSASPVHFSVSSAFVVGIVIFGSEGFSGGPVQTAGNLCECSTRFTASSAMPRR